MASSEAASGVTIPCSTHELSRAATSRPETIAKQRLTSIDALRGFTMFWLIGGREVFLGIAALFLGTAWFDAVDTQLTHPKWQGFVAWDMVMPTFLFIVGASMPFAVAKRREEGASLTTTYWRIVRRFAALWALGMINQASKPGAEGPELYSNTLQAIAAGYLITSVALLHFRWRGQVGLFAALVLLYGALLMFVPFPDHPAGTLQRTANLPRFVDEVIFGEFRHDHSFTWLLTTLGFAATVLLGSQAGQILRKNSSANQKLLQLATAGAVCMAAGWVWSYWLPFNRHLWTSSMILWAGGIGFVLTAAFYLVIDVLGFHRWTFPFIIIGANALLAYIIDPLVNQITMTAATGLFPDYPALQLVTCAAVVELAIVWSILLFLYRRRIFLRA